MPIPVRANSVRSATADPKSTTTTTARATPISQLRKPQSGRLTKTVAEAKNTSSSLVVPSTGNDEVSSRIPSPFKQDNLNGNLQSSRVDTSTSRPRTVGHARQRSAVVPALNSRPRFGHTRSTSTISVNTSFTASTSDSDQSKSDPTKLGFRALPRQVGSPAKSRLDISARPGTASTLSRPVNPSLSDEILLCELLQLTLVHDKSRKVLQKYQNAIDSILSARKADLLTVHHEIEEKQNAYNHALNLEAIGVLLQNHGSQQTCQLVQNFSIAVRDLQNLEHIFEGEDGLAATFHSWVKFMTADRAEIVLSDHGPGLHLQFEEYIGPELKRFKQQLYSVLTTFTNMPTSAPESSLAIISKHHITLTTSLLQECQLMSVVGQSLAEEHRCWLESEIETSLRDTPDAQQLVQLPLFFAS